MTGNSFNPTQRPIQILVVDDNAINLRLMSAALTRLGHNVDSADDGAAAVVKFADNHYDAILMDIMMPIMDGITATREIRKIESARQTGADGRTKIIAITANAFDDDRAKLFEAGMDHYMTKPVDISELQRLLNL
ncbi:MAG: response regulator [Bacteroidetes bacterium]|nr:response regulator [Bacteroidota bacterium]